LFSNQTALNTFASATVRNGTFFNQTQALLGGSIISQETTIKNGNNSLAVDQVYPDARIYKNEEV